MARALQDILTELNSVYNPQRQSAQGIYDKGIEATNPMESADLAGLEQAKKDSFDQITTGANRRGMFFSGVPLKEQAQYVGQNFLPGVANLKNRYAGIRGNLYQTLAQTLGNIDVEKNKYGREIYNAEVAQDLEREKQAQAAKASAGSGGGFGGFNLNGGNTGTNVLGASTQVSSALQNQYNSMFYKPGGGKWSDADLASDYNATYASAKNGNKADMQKLQLYHAERPDLFGSAPQGNLSTTTAPYNTGAKIPQTYNWQQSQAQTSTKPKTQAPLYSGYGPIL